MLSFQRLPSVRPLPSSLTPHGRGCALSRTVELPSKSLKSQFVRSGRGCGERRGPVAVKAQRQDQDKGPVTHTDSARLRGGEETTSSSSLQPPQADIAAKSDQEAVDDSRPRENSEPAATNSPSKATNSDPLRLLSEPPSSEWYLQPWDVPWGAKETAFGMSAWICRCGVANIEATETSCS